MRNTIYLAATLVALASMTAAVSAPTAEPAAAAGHDGAMLALASHSGCLTCHSIKPSAASDPGTRPVGPAWEDVASKYRGQKGAVRKLTATVMQGSNPYQSHWKGKVSGLAMPPNAVAINRQDARALVHWILSLDGRDI